MESGFDTEQVSDEYKATFIENVKIRQFSSKEPSKKAIVCFDVNKEGVIAIGCGNSEHKTVSVYSQDGEFQDAYTFKTYGDYNLEWDGNNLNIYFVRSDAIVSVSPDGEIVDICKAKNNTENTHYN